MSFNIKTSFKDRMCDSNKNYQIIISNKLDFQKISTVITESDVLIVTNKTLKGLNYLSIIKRQIKRITLRIKVCILDDGEKYKNQLSINKIYKVLIKSKYSSKCVIIALGGGVIGDVSGFVASTYHRGTKIIQIPTTLLSQLDSSIGGKNAINHLYGKNLIGTFFQPNLVCIAINFLNTLPNKEFTSGMAEVIKYACIIDTKFFNWLNANVESIKLKKNLIIKEMIKRSCQIKAKIVSIDETGTGKTRDLLNLGHTFGHAIEYCKSFKGITHGEAVAIGIAMAAEMSYQLQYISRDELVAIQSLLEKFSLSIKIPNNITAGKIIYAMKNDKKNVNCNITLVLLKTIGQGIIVTNVSSTFLRTFIKYYMKK